jgi:hypothetical protein
MVPSRPDHGDRWQCDHGLRRLPAELLQDTNVEDITQLHSRWQLELVRYVTHLLENFIEAEEFGPKLATTLHIE